MILENLKSRIYHVQHAAAPNWSSGNSRLLVYISTILMLVGIVFIYRLCLHPLARLPGPFWAKVSGEWLNYHYRQGQWHETVLELHGKYGRIVRISPNELSVVDEWATKNLYGHGYNAAKTSWYNVWDPPVNTAPQMFSELNKTRHAFLRKRASAAYSMSSILKYEVYIQHCLDILLCKLEKHAKREQALDMSNWTNAMAFDVVGELAYGQKLGHLEKETDVNGLRKTIFDIFKILSILGHYPGQAWWTQNPLTDLIMKVLKVQPVLANFQNWTVAKVQSRLDHLEEVDRNDLLGHFCRMTWEDGSPVQLNEIVIEAINIIGAGADTTSIGMRTCIYYLAKHRKYYDMVQAEVDAAYKQKQKQEPVTYLETQKMPILKAVIKEALRLRPSIVFQLPRYAPENFVVRGHYIPAGTQVGTSPIAQNRDPEVFGMDADIFRPERFLESNEKAKYLDSCTMTFGGNGPRMCVGKNIALVELHKFVAQLIYNFDFEFADRDRPWHIKTYWFAFQENMFMKLKKRPSRTLRIPSDVNI